MGRWPLPDRDGVVSIGDGPQLSNQLSKVWRVHVWQNYNEKNSFHVLLFIDIIPSHKESPNFWHVISQLRATLYWNHIVPDRQGSAASKIRNHCISPSLRVIRGWVIYDSVRFANFCFSILRIRIESETLFTDLFTLEKLRHFFF